MVRPSQSTLADELAVDLRTVNRWMAELKKLGYVVVEDEGARAGEASVYELSWLPCLAAEGDDTDGVGQTLETGEDDMPDIPGCVTDGVLEMKSIEKKNNTAAVAPVPPNEPARPTTSEDRPLDQPTGSTVEPDRQD